MLTIFQKTLKDTEIRHLDARAKGVWVSVTDPSPDEVSGIVAEYEIEEDLIRDALDPYEVPRVEEKDGIVYIFSRFPYAEGEEVLTMPVLIAVGEDFVMTISRTPLPFHERLIVNRGRRKVDIPFTTTQKTRLVTLILSNIISEFETFLVRIRRQVRAAQVRIEEINNENILRMVFIENMLNEFMNALQPTQSMLETLLLGRILKLYERDHDLIEDLLLQNGQLVGACTTNLKTIINVREAYSTIMTTNLNKVLRFFAALTIILTIPTLLGSLFGMNVPVPFSDSPYAFGGILLGAVLVTAMLYVIFVKNDWI